MSLLAYFECHYLLDSPPYPVLFTFGLCIFPFPSLSLPLPPTFLLCSPDHMSPVSTLSPDQSCRSLGQKVHLSPPVLWIWQSQLSRGWSLHPLHNLAASCGHIPVSLQVWLPAVLLSYTLISLTVATLGQKVLPMQQPIKSQANMALPVLFSAPKGC